MLGLESTISIGKQASAADPTTQARTSLNIYGITGGGTDQDADDNILGGGLNNASDPVAPAPGLDDHKLTIKTPICCNQTPALMAAFFGTAASTGADPDFEHEWTSGQALPYVFLEHRLKSGRLRRHFGLVGESMTIDLSSDREGFGMIETTFVGLKENKETSALAGVVTAAPTLDRPAQKLCSVIYNEVAGGNIIGGKFTFKRTLKRLRAADGTGIPYAVEVDNISALTGSIRVRFDDGGLLDDAFARTERTLALQLMRAAARGVKFAMPHARLSRTPTDIPGPGGLEMDIPLRGWQTSSDAALTAQVLNGEETATF